MKPSSFLRQAEVVVVELEPAALLAPVQVQGAIFSPRSASSPIRKCQPRVVPPIRTGNWPSGRRSSLQTGQDG